MISFLLCLAILIVGYFVYGKIVDRSGPHLWCHAGRFVGAGGLFVDHLRHHLCRRCA